jgi:hypothetical protein
MTRSNVLTFLVFIATFSVACEQPCPKRSLYPSFSTIGGMWITSKMVVDQRSYTNVRLDQSRHFGPFGIWDFKAPGMPKSPTRRGHAPHLP